MNVGVMKDYKLRDLRASHTLLGDSVERVHTPCMTPVDPQVVPVGDDGSGDCNRDSSTSMLSGLWSSRTMPCHSNSS
jgi:hypothetical protein